MARQVVVPIGLGCTAVFCTLPGSAFADWITVADRRPGAIGVPAGATLDAPAPVEERWAPRRKPFLALELHGPYGNEVTTPWQSTVRFERRAVRGALPRRKCPA